MRFYDEYQTKIFLDTARKTDANLYPLFYLAINTGMRQSELMGLKWNDLNWDQSTIQVKRQVRHFKGGGYTFGKPKSKSGNRTIVLGDKALKILQTHQINLREIVQTLNDQWKNLNLIFPSRVGTPLTASNIRRSFRKLIKESGLQKIRFHDLRHTAASLMLNNGIPALIVSKRLGHSKTSITIDVYGHLIPIKEEEAANLMDRLLV